MTTMEWKRSEDVSITSGPAYHIDTGRDGIYRYSVEQLLNNRWVFVVMNTRTGRILHRSRQEYAGLVQCQVAAESHAARRAA